MNNKKSVLMPFCNALLLISLQFFSCTSGITIEAHMESTLPTAETDQTLNTPSPINVPPTTVSNFHSHQKFKGTKSTVPTTTSVDDDDETFTPTTVFDSTNENYTFNTLQRTELPTDPMPPSFESRVKKGDRRKLVTNKRDKSEPDFIRFRLPVNVSSHMALAKQIPSITSDPLEPIGTAVDYLVSRNPCSCEFGVCKCCTGVVLNTFNSKGCAHLRYDPEQFSFELKMMLNDRVMYKRQVSGKNPKPICINPRRLPFLEVCVNFYDIYFIGRNMHLCMEMNANFNDFEVFNRDFECMHFGSSGVGLAPPGDNSGLPQSSYTGVGGFQAEVDQSDGSDIEDYDENVRKIKNKKKKN
ncbi:uncharacterized protein LOC134829215 [Culicoides brevitarsis]|uniref:uncharacterized protein LOC134829215 n=1 Tax=Culicoides brevitarsis TaxID=469753 RepID=UPI00307B4B58